MIEITVISARSASVNHPVAAQFGPDGGTIGRAATNTLVLDDPERTVSRVHAQVLCRDGRYFIVDRGSNPMLRNGFASGTGNEAPLNDGDRLTIGSFELAVQVLADAAPAAGSSAQPGVDSRTGVEDPFANLLAGLDVPPKVSAAPASQAAPEGVPDPFADLLAPPPPPDAPLAPHSAGGRGALDDLAELATPIGQGAPSIDSLFGAGTGAGLGGDPLAGSPLADPLHQPNTAVSADPLAALVGGPASSTPPPRDDHVPIGRFGFVPPQAMEAVPAAASPSIPAVADAVSSAPASASAPVAVQAQAAHSAAAPRASDDLLLAALLRGLQGLHPPSEALTPAFMERVGALLHDAVQGTLQLLLTRQEFKRELRAEMTMIATQANNPLKFSPTVEVALAHLLGPGVRGFMPAEAAMRDAFDDLRAHQFGVMVGMRAALARLIARFAPSELEKKITAKSALDSLFAAHRKAKLWDQFVQFYAEIATEAEEDFHGFFGKALVQAYEEQMARFKAAESSDSEVAR